MAGFGALFLEKAGVFDCNAGLAGEDTHQFEMAFVVCALVVGEDAQSADGVIVSDKRNATEGPGSAERLDAELADFGDEVVANKNGLASAENIFGEMVAGRAGALGKTNALDEFEVEVNLVA